MEKAAEIVKRLADEEPLRGLLAAAPSRAKDIAALSAKLCAIPAPTFHEGPRAEAVEAEMKWRGIPRIEKDSAGNVLATLDSGHAGASLLVAAHMDTVFPPGTPCKAEERSGWLYGPGIADNASGMAVAIIAAECLFRHSLPRKGKITFSFTVGEEGLGNLRGMRHLFENAGRSFDVVLAIDGDLGHVLHEPVGSRRYRLATAGPGGHSWANFGRPSALHALIQIAEPLTRMRVPASPRTTFNIGVLSGGTSVNTIAAEAELLMDLRSTDGRALDAVEAQFLEIVRGAEMPQGISLQIQKVGDRPVGDGALAREPADIVSCAMRFLGIEPVASASSTDANIPLSLGIPATTMGIRRGVGVHSPEEGLEIASLGSGLQIFILALPSLVEAYSFVPPATKEKGRPR